jgi:hypothetical protein
LIVASRTHTTIDIEMSEPGESTTEVLGYQLFINDMNSNAVPSNLVYDGQAISNILTVTVEDLVSGQSYWLSYKVLNRAGWSGLSPYLQMTTGRLPAPPPQTPYQIAVSPNAIEFGW